MNQPPPKVWCTMIFYNLVTGSRERCICIFFKRKNHSKMSWEHHRISIYQLDKIVQIIFIVNEEQLKHYCVIPYLENSCIYYFRVLFHQCILFEKNYLKNTTGDSACCLFFVKLWNTSNANKSLLHSEDLERFQWLTHTEI